MISNIDIIGVERKQHYSFSISNWLINNGVPVLGLDEQGYYFAKTQLLKDKLENAPLWIKILIMFE